jgi:hypothetical protein
MCWTLNILLFSKSEWINFMHKEKEYLLFTIQHKERKKERSRNLAERIAIIQFSCC